jgi:hypothetical protein
MRNRHTKEFVRKWLSRNGYTIYDLQAHYHRYTGYVLRDNVLYESSTSDFKAWLELC